MQFLFCVLKSLPAGHLLLILSPTSADTPTHSNNMLSIVGVKCITLITDIIYLSVCNMTKNVNDPPNHEEIANISARVFRRDQQQSHTPPVINLNEYFARNLNMKLSHDSTKHQINAIRTGSSSLRQMLPIALCLFTFASVLSMLIIYIDTTGS